MDIRHVPIAKLVAMLADTKEAVVARIIRREIERRDRQSNKTADAAPRQEADHA